MDIDSVLLIAQCLGPSSQCEPYHVIPTHGNTES